MERQEFYKMIGVDYGQDYYDNVEAVYMAFDFLTKYDMLCLYRYHCEAFVMAWRYIQDKKNHPDCYSVELAKKYVENYLKKELGYI